MWRLVLNAELAVRAWSPGLEVGGRERREHARARALSPPSPFSSFFCFPRPTHPTPPSSNRDNTPMFQEKVPLTGAPVRCVERVPPACATLSLSARKRKRRKKKNIAAQCGAHPPMSGPATDPSRPRMGHSSRCPATWQLWRATARWKRGQAVAKVASSSRCFKRGGLRRAHPCPSFATRLSSPLSSLGPVPRETLSAYPCAQTTTGVRAAGRARRGADSDNAGEECSSSHPLPLPLLSSFPQAGAKLASSIKCVAGAEGECRRGCLGVAKWRRSACGVRKTRPLSLLCCVPFFFKTPRGRR